MKKRIVVVDSGLGGLFVLKECEKIIGGYDFIYVADTFNAPYGSKGKQELKKIAEGMVGELIKKYNPEMVILACNTLTVNTINFLRQKFRSVVFVGVEPAIKQAKIYGGDTVVLATPATQKKFKILERKVERELKKEYRLSGLRYQNDDKVFLIADVALASIIESNFENLDNILPYIKKLFASQKFVKAQNLVLGCTHYLAIKKQLNLIVPNATIFDCSMAVAAHAKSLLIKKQRLMKNKTNIKFVSTDGNKNYIKKLEKYYNLIKNN